jgi:hypothetical protein
MATREVETGTIHNPVDIERKIVEVKNRIAQGVSIVSSAEDEARRKRREYDVAYARAYLNAEGSIPDRKYKAVLATEAQREAAEVAETAFNHAKRTAEALEKEIFAWQSISKSVVAMFGSVRP